MRLALAWALLLSGLPGGAQARDEAAEDEGRQQAIAAKVMVHGEVCPQPERPCTELEPFAPNELSFRLLRKFEFDRGEDRSRPFYAAILTSGELCRIGDAERLAAQAAFPGRKVFVHQFMCAGFSDKVTYTNVNRKAGFIAVYAGKSEAEARQFLAQAQARFPDANLRRMQVVVVYQLE